MILLFKTIRYEDANDVVCFNQLLQLTTIDILRYRAGVCREFVKLFEEMCLVSGKIIL